MRNTKRLKVNLKKKVKELFKPRNLKKAQVTLAL